MPPIPIPDDNSTRWARQVLSQLLEKLHITDVDVSTCVNDFAGAAVSFQDFAADIKAKNYNASVVDLSRGVTALSRIAAGCGVPEVQQKLDALAASMRWANISTGFLDRGVKILVDASDLWHEMAAVAAAIESGNPDTVADKMGALIAGWTAVTGGCGDDQACKLLDGLLRVLQVSASDVKPCQIALTPAVHLFNASATAFLEHKFYAMAVGWMAQGLDQVYKVAKSDSCGLKPVADAIGGLSSQLKKAEVRIESSDVTKIIIGSADVYDEMYALVTDLNKTDYAGAGIQIGALLAQLRASNCQTKACIIVEGLMASLQVSIPDLQECSKDLDETWDDFEVFMRALKLRDWDNALSKLSALLMNWKNAMQGCDVQKVAKILEDTSERLHLDSFANEVEGFLQVLANGADISKDLAKIIADADNKQWAALGQDLGGLSDWITSKHCNSLVCRIAEGVLAEANIALDALKPCERTLRDGEGFFTAGAAMWTAGDKESAIKSLASGLNSISKSVSECGLTKQLGWVEQEANVLGLGNLTILENVSTWVVHGSDFYDELFGAFQDVQNNDYRSAGTKLAIVMNDLSQWTKGHLCTEPACYMVNGMMQFLGDLGADAKQCKTDLKDAWSNFKHGYKNLTGQASIFSSFNNNTRNITQGVHDIGIGLEEMAKGVSDCHVQDLLTIMNALGAKFLRQPEISWIDAFLKILIDGVPIEKELANACEDFGNQNWPGFGYNLIKLSKTLLRPVDVSIYV